LADERTSETSCQDVSALKQNENAVEEESTIYQKNPDLDNEKSQKQEETPGEVVQLVRLSANYYSKGLIVKAQAVANLTMDLGLETCVACIGKGRPDWQVTLFDDFLQG
jgi:hypothetical protein